MSACAMFIGYSHCYLLPSPTKKKTVLDGSILIVLITGDFFPILCMFFPSQEHIKHRLDISHILVSSKGGNLLVFLPKEEKTAAALACQRTHTSPVLGLKDTSLSREKGSVRIPVGSPLGAVQGCGLLSTGLAAMFPLNHFSSATNSAAVSSPPGNARRLQRQIRCEPRDTEGKEKLFTEMGIVFYHFSGHQFQTRFTLEPGWFNNGWVFLLLAKTPIQT